MEMTTACYQYPEAKILAFIPSGEIGSLMDFSNTSIVRMMKMGESACARAALHVDAKTVVEKRCGMEFAS